MARRHEYLYALNAGGVDPDAVSRIDLEKMRLAAEHPMSNLLPRVLGPAALRPGTQSLSRIAGDAETRQIRFMRSIGTSYVLLMSPGEMRIALDGTVQTVPAVSTATANGSWSNVSTSPATASASAGVLTLSASATQSAKMRQTVTVSGGDQSTVHVLRVEVTRGPVVVRVGTTAGAQNVLADAELDTGTHKLAFTPGAGTIYVEVRADDYATRIVNRVQFEANILGGSGDLVIPTPWATIADVEALRTWQSIDTMFVGDGSVRQRRIEHRGPQSWGIAEYKTDDGPFAPGESRLTMTPAALRGNTTVTASESYFLSSHVGALLELTQSGKIVQQNITGADQTSDYVTIIGTGTSRLFYYSASLSTFTGTVILEQSFDADEPVTWTTVNTFTSGSFTPLTSANDGLSNLTVHYRFRCTAYTSGSCDVQLQYQNALTTGRARIVGYTSGTQVSIEVLKAFGNTTATRSWRIGAWSDVLGWPRVPVIQDARLHWFLDDDDYATKVDEYYTYDDSGEGDSEPFTRSVGIGGQDGVLWALSQSKLIVGTQAAEAIISASELDEPLTPTKYTVRRPSRRGCADVAAVEHDNGLFFVQRSRKRLYEINADTGKYQSQDVSRLNPHAYSAGIVRLAVQQQPDTRCYAVMDDGQLAVMTYERGDQVVAVTTIDVAGGIVEDVCTLPDTDQDDVYLIVNRGGERYHERLAKEAAQRSVSTCATLDAHKVLAGSISSITGGTHLAGETVAVWADGQRRADVTLDGSGAAALGATYSRVVYGLPYTASFKSVKLAYAAGLGTALGQTKIVHGAAVILSNSCLDGVTIGGNDTTLDPLPAIVNGAERTGSQFFSHYDQDIFPVQAEWNSDARVWISVDSAEGPCTIQAIVLDVETRDGSGAQAGD